MKPYSTKLFIRTLKHIYLDHFYQQCYYNQNSSQPCGAPLFALLLLFVCEHA